MCSFERGKLGKGLAMILLILLLIWVMLVFFAVLLLLSCSCTMFSLVLHNVLQNQTSNLHCKVWIRGLFLVLIHCPWLFWPNPPTNLPEFWRILANLGCCSYLCVYTIGPAILRPFLPLPVSNLLALLTTRFSIQICLVLSLLLLIVVQCTPLYHLQLSRKICVAAVNTILDAFFAC